MTNAVLTLYTILLVFCQLHADPSLMSNIRDREAIAEKVCEKLGFKSAVELGVRKGEFAINNLRMWPSCEKYILVDIWGHQENYIDLANLDNDEQEKIYQETKKLLLPYNDKLLYYRNLTTVAATFVPDSSIDFVYVDARHDYCGCKEDIEAWWPKVKHGGIMAGHDYITAAEHKLHIPQDDWSLCGDGKTVHVGSVKAAVDEFAEKHNLRVFKTADKPWISWMFSRKDIHLNGKARIDGHNSTFMRGSTRRKIM